MATTLAGETGISVQRFVVYDGIGAALWAGGALILGAIFHAAVGVFLLELEDLGRYALIFMFAAIALFFAYKWWQRYRFMLQIRMARISADELRALLDADAGTVVLDVRTAEQRASRGWIPGAIHVRDIGALELDRTEGEVIVYCDCPNEASAAVLARSLKNKGFTHVRPLAGGLDAWMAQGHPVVHEMPPPELVLS